MISTAATAAGQQYLCDQGSGKFQARTREGVAVAVGPEREEGLAKRDCDASISWGKDQLAVAANAATVDLDLLGATLNGVGPVAAFQVRSNPNSFMSYVIYSLRKPPHLVRKLIGASSFSAADTGLENQIEIWADDAAAVDGLDGLLASEFDFLPTSVLRFEHGRLLDVSAEFQPYYDHVIASVRGELTPQELATSRPATANSALRPLPERNVCISFAKRRLGSWNSSGHLCIAGAIRMPGGHWKKCGRRRICRAFKGCSPGRALTACNRKLMA